MFIFCLHVCFSSFPYFRFRSLSVCPEHAEQLSSTKPESAKLMLEAYPKSVFNNISASTSSGIILFSVHLSLCTSFISSLFSLHSYISTRYFSPFCATLSFHKPCQLSRFFPFHLAFSSRDGRFSLTPFFLPRFRRERVLDLDGGRRRRAPAAPAHPPQGREGPRRKRIRRKLA